MTTLSLVSKYARQAATAIELGQMFESGRNVNEEVLLRNAQFLYKELPIRLAKRVMELKSLPYGLSNKEPVETVCDWYVQSFRDVLSRRKPNSTEDELAFTDLLETILDRHKNVVPTMATGILELKEEMGDAAVEECPFLHDFLDRFYLSRIGIRMLIHQHIAVHFSTEGFVGIIESEMHPQNVVERAVDDATMKVDRAYGMAPEVTIDCPDDLAFPYVPQHLHHMMHELLKNSFRAVVEHHGSARRNEDLPPVNIVIAEGGDEITIKVSDQGGGIPHDHIDRIFTYLYTTAEAPADVREAAIGGGLTNAPLAGFGYGLPLSRLFARYFGGDLELVSMDGFGTNAYLHLNKLDNSSERLP